MKNILFILFICVCVSCKQQSKNDNSENKSVTIVEEGLNISNEDNYCTVGWGCILSVNYSLNTHASKIYILPSENATILPLNNLQLYAIPTF